MPKSEEFRITSQLLRAATSVPANVAEGWSRSTRKDFANFISVARGSLAEVETLLLLSVRIGLVTESDANLAISSADRLGRQLNRLKTQLANPQSRTPNPQS